MNQKKGLVNIGIAVLLTIVLLSPISVLMENGKDIDHTAQETVEPILRIRRDILEEKDETGATVGSLIDLEDVWAIEDSRQESRNPLVTSMFNGDAALGYDREKNTFYCTLGLETGETWPEIELKAKNVPEGLEIRLVDDYTYDWCSDAIREGYRYEMIAYTDDEYSYLGVVFTGMPIVTLHIDSGRAIRKEYVPVRANVSSAEYEPIASAAMVHLRGGGSEERVWTSEVKDSFRLEFETLDQKGRVKQQSMSVLGMDADSDWYLLGNELDESCIRNYLCWEIWNKWNPEGNAPTLLKSRLVELFLNDQYQGIYQLMQRIDPEKELLSMGGNPQTDYVFRVIRGYNIDQDRPYRDYRNRSSFILELRHKPEHVSEKDAFKKIENYVLLNQAETKTDDAAFAGIAEKSLDLESLIHYFLFLQAVDLAEDNVNNNLYIWVMRQSDGRYVYRFSPWDMDFGLSSSYSGGGGSNDKIDLSMHVARRILAGNFLNSRELIWKIWQEKSAAIFTEDAIYEWIVGLEERVNQSGAYLRDSERWQGEAQILNMAHFSANEIAHIGAVEYYMKELWPIEDQGNAADRQSN